MKGKVTLFSTSFSKTFTPDYGKLGEISDLIYRDFKDVHPNVT